MAAQKASMLLVCGPHLSILSSSQDCTRIDRTLLLPFLPLNNAQKSSTIDFGQNVHKGCKAFDNLLTIRPNENFHVACTEFLIQALRLVDRETTTHLPFAAGRRIIFGGEKMPDGDKKSSNAAAAGSELAEAILRVSHSSMQDEAR